MSVIRLGAAANVRDFQNLSNALATRESNALDPEALQDEFGRFRVWSGNLGALQKGHSSLDYRLRDAPLLLNEVSKLLSELKMNLGAAYDILTGVRLPYEQQPTSYGEEGDDEDEDEISEEEEDDGDDSSVPKSELSMRFHEVVDIIDHLYKISVRIRAPTVRIRSLKAASYRPKDSETGVDLLEQYAIFDHNHTQELLRFLRTPHIHGDNDIAEDDELIARLARGITLRRRQFKYWRRHRDKLGISVTSEEPQAPAPLVRPAAPFRHDTIEAQAGTPEINVTPRSVPSQRTSKTLLSGTEATQHHQSLDDIVDSKSVTSYAVTVKDLSGKGIDLPPPPKAANGDKDFECPYCFIICPARYGKGRPWRTHVLQDLQPYICTYKECDASEQLFRSRRDWSEHESSHRKVWRCPEHLDAVYKSQSGLEEHFKQNHEESISGGQLSTIVKIGETSTIDQRKKCPICFASVDAEGLGSLQNHIANHLERIAVFSLPIEADDDSDGGSSKASRGGTESSALPTTSEPSEISNTSDFSGVNRDLDETTGYDPTIGLAARNDTSGNWHIDDASAYNNPAEPETSQTGNLSQKPLSKAFIQTLPDESENRIELLLSVNDEEQTDSDESQKHDSPDGVDSVDRQYVSESDFEEHMAQRRTFRKYLLSLTGAQSVRFDWRHGSWDGNITFTDSESAVSALQSFDIARYPSVKIQQRDSKKDVLEFSMLQPQSKKQVSMRSKPAGSDLSLQKQQLPLKQEDAKSPLPVRSVADIPTLHALYRSGELLPRNDRRYVPNNAYNDIISFIYYDITRLKVDAIVNSSNRTLSPGKAEWTLDHKIHRAAGPELREECSRLGKLKSSQCVLTSGHQLPCTHIIHVARAPHGSKEGQGQENVLIDSYRGVLKLALHHELKTIAFCCLGTGGVGIPARIASRIALQETREFLDAHPTHSFERIVFCVFHEDNIAAYTDVFPVFFPPTPEDLQNAVAIRKSRSDTKLSAMIQEVCTQIDSISQSITIFGTGTLSASHHVAHDLSRIAVFLERLEVILASPGERIENSLPPVLRYLELLCSVLLAFCTDMTEMVELAKGKESLGQPSYKNIWDDYNDHMGREQGMTIMRLIALCREFTQQVVNVLDRNTSVPHEMKIISTQLDAWLFKRNEEGSQNRHDQFEETLLARREYERDSPAKGRGDTLKLHQIPTLARLYDVGTIQSKATQAVSSARSNHIICLTRHDITRLEVDILVNSTDKMFSGIGSLDRSVFLGGGLDLEEECANHAPCNEGEVILTGGYSLPVKHVLHAIPPAIYEIETKDILRGMYRKILHMASFLKATSIAIPSLGTGMLNYPRRDAAAIAIEEVKRFLESMDESNPIEKIVLVVFSLNDEFVYKTLIPVYLPPHNPDVDSMQRTSVAVEPPSPPPRTLFGTIGQAFRKISSGKLPAYSKKRPLEPSEEDVLIAFETHAQGCTTCANIPTVYASGKDLCDDGYRLAAQVLRYLYMKSDRSVHSLRSEEATQAEVEIPEDLFPISLELLTTVEKSFRDPDRDRPFVSNQPALGKLRRPEFTVYKLQVTVRTRNNPERVFYRIHIWSDPSNGWESFQASEPTLHLTRGSLVIREGGNESVSKSCTRLYLNPQSIFSRLSPTEILVDHPEADRLSVEEYGSHFTLKFESQTDCEMLLTRLKHAAVNSPSATGRLDMKKGLAQVFSWSHSLEQWESLDPQDAEATFLITRGNLQIFQTTSTLKSWLEIELLPRSTIEKLSEMEILIETPSTDGGSDQERAKKVKLECRSLEDCDRLLAHLKRATDDGKPSSHSEQRQTEESLPESSGPQIVPPGVTIDNAEITVPSQDLPEKDFAHVSVWGNSAKKWALFTSSDSAASLYITPGYLEIVANGSETSHNIQLRLKLTPLSVIQRHSDVEILMDGFLTEGVSVALTPYVGRYMLKCSSKANCDALQLKLERAIKSSPHEAVIDENPPLPDSTNQYDFNEQITSPETQGEADRGKPHSNEDPAENTETQEPEASDSEPNLSPLLPPDNNSEEMSSRLPTISIDDNTNQPGGPSQNSHQVPNAPESPPLFTGFIDPKAIPIETLHIDQYFEHADAPPLSSTSEQQNVPKGYAKPFTKIDKRLVYRSVLEKAELEFWEKEHWFHVFKVVGEEEMMQLHLATRGLWERGVGITSHLSLKNF